MYNNCNNIHYYVIYVSVDTEIMLSDIVALYNVVESIHKIEIMRHSDLNKRDLRESYFGSYVSDPMYHPMKMVIARL